MAPAVAELCAELDCQKTDVAAVAVGVGPGPYTSLRVGIMYAKSVGYALAVPVVGVCTHDAIARDAVRRALPAAGAPFLVATDARRREVYVARYDPSGERIGGPAVMTAAEACRSWPDDEWVATPGLTVPLPEDRLSPLFPDARVLVEMVAGAWPVDPASLGSVAGGWSEPRGPGNPEQQVPLGLLRPEPLYLRRPDAAEPVAR